jgi:hypothetical protein
MRTGKYTKYLLLLLVCAISFSADAKRKKRKKKKAKTTITASTVVSDSTKVVPLPKTNTPVNVIKEDNKEIKLAQLVVSFASMGAGIDAKSRQKFLEHITWFNEQHHIELMYDKKSWGREGEMDYCFYGNNEILMPILFKELKEKLANGTKVFVKQNFPCK